DGYEHTRILWIWVWGEQNLSPRPPHCHAYLLSPSLAWFEVDSTDDKTTPRHGG
ncbi:hypothetical protein A2U01_0069914, partial [Trifolium medium]|nr:hypothetical protein [Trifolium medium]